MPSAHFYQQPAVLDREQHRHIKLKPVTDARFAARAKAVPLVGVEFPDACMEYPIVFVPVEGGKWLALAVTGLAEEENLFIDEQGQWSARYVPASVRRYPFILAESGSEQLGVAIDFGCANVADGADKEGERLFSDKGEPTAMLKSIMDLLADYQGQIAATETFIKRLADAGLLMEAKAEIKADPHTASLSGCWIIDEEKLRQLTDATAAAWFRSGELALVYAQMLSLRNLIPLLKRRKAPPVIAPAKRSESAAPNKSK